MQKKTHNQAKTGNIAKVKYFLPSSSQNRLEVPHNEQNRLNQIKRSISNKYKGSYSSSKKTSKRASVSKIQNYGNSMNSEINLNEDASFEIVAIRDAQQNSKEYKNSNYQKIECLPLGEHKNNNKHRQDKLDESKQWEMGLRFGNEKERRKVLQSSQVLNELSKGRNMQHMIRNFPSRQEKRQFERFIQGLKDDKTYQNTITMFTMMYFYQQKGKKK